MDVPRTIAIHMDGHTQSVMQEETNYKEWVKAIGYLSTWNMSYPLCEIFADGKTDMVAIYRAASGERKYVIGAVWHDDHYGFHS